MKQHCKSAINLSEIVSPTEDTRKTETKVEGESVTMMEKKMKDIS